MWDVISWSKGLAVEIAGQDVINHAGAAALRIIADRTGLTAGLSRALARRGFVPVHDRGRVLADTAVLIADGGRVLSDLATLRDQAQLLGPVASDPTLWRALSEIGEDQRGKVARARAKTREHVWSLLVKRWRRPNPRPCATACCTPPPVSSTASANARSASPRPGLGPSNWPPACAPHSRYPHPPHADQPRPDPNLGKQPELWNPAPTRRDNRAPRITIS